MAHRDQRHHRRSIRLRGYDYSQPGAYFVTICTQGKLPLFGHIVEGIVQMNDAGAMIDLWYRKLEENFQGFCCDEFVCMPDHVHFIMINKKNIASVEFYDRNMRKSLSRLVQWFKTVTTNAYIQGVRQQGWTPFPGRLWQRNYWEHIIRNEEELNDIRQYIINNPANWYKDDNNLETAIIEPRP